MKKKLTFFIFLFSCLFNTVAYCQQLASTIQLSTSVKHTGPTQSIRPVNLERPVEIHLYLEQSGHSRKIEQNVGLSMMITGGVAVAAGLLLIDKGKKEELANNHNPKVYSSPSTKTIIGQGCIIGGVAVFIPGAFIFLFNQKKQSK